MDWIDLQADLPDFRDDEPPSLRGDIVDELADHLQCALRRELLLDHNEVTARQRVLDRFGDPRKIARRLWWQAMWSRVMQQRIASVLQWTITLAALLVSGIVLWQQSQMLAEFRQAHAEDSRMRAMLTARLEQWDGGHEAATHPPRLDPGEEAPRDREPQLIDPDSSDNAAYYPDNTPYVSPTPPARSPYNASPGLPPEDPLPTLDGPLPLVVTPHGRMYPPGANQAGVGKLSVRVVCETAEGPLVRPRRVELALNGSTTGIDLIPSGVAPDSQAILSWDSSGDHPIPPWIEFPDLVPDRYELTVDLSDGQQCATQVLIRDHNPQMLTVVCPKPRERIAVLVAAEPLPEDLIAPKCEFKARLTPGTIVIDGFEWKIPLEGPQFAKFDPQTGNVVGLEIWTVDGSRSVDLKRARAEDRVLFLHSGPTKVQLSATCPTEQPDISRLIYWPTATEDSLEYAIAADAKTLSLPLPPQFVNEVRHEMRSLRVRSVAPAMAAPRAFDASNARILTVKLLPEKAGELVQGVNAVCVVNSDGDSYCGRLMNDDDSPTYAFLDALEPDRYKLHIELADGQRSVRQIVVRDETPQVLEITTPAPRKKTLLPVSIVPPAEESQRKVGTICVTITPTPMTLGDSTWECEHLRTVYLQFNSETGLTDEYSTADASGNLRTQNLKSLPVSDRAVSLPRGPVAYRFMVKDDFWPKVEDPPLTVVIEPSQQEWRQNLPVEFVQHLADVANKNAAKSD